MIKYVKGEGVEAITEVKNPISGRIVADKVGKITYNEFAKSRECQIGER